MRGAVHCLDSVVLEVDKKLNTRYAGNILRVRCYSYRYVDYVPGKYLLLKYHNLHRDSDEYHHRIYDLDTGEEIVHEILKRYRFPLFSEALDELQALV